MTTLPNQPMHRMSAPPFQLRYRRSSDVRLAGERFLSALITDLER